MVTIRTAFKAIEKKDCETPILNYCRYLLDEDFPPETRLEIFREREEPDVIVPNIGKAAILDCDGVSFYRSKKYDKYAQAEPV